MPRLDRLGLDDRTLGILASLPVPITLAESLLSRDSEQLALECRVSLRAVSKLRYLVALRCQAQPIIPDNRLRGDDGGDTSSSRNASSTSNGSNNTLGSGQVGARGQGEDVARSSSAAPVLSFCTADVLYRQAKEVGGYVTTGSDRLDSLLCKGLMLHHVVEVVGRSSAGKTQLCLTAAVAAASHGIGVLYLDTANGGSVRRMQQIARSRYADANGEMTVRQMDALLDRLRIVQAFDISTVISALVAYMDGVTSSSTPSGVYSSCRLVILDSVTAVISPLLGGVKNPAGHGLMATLGHLLNRTASQCSACVLVANSTVASRGGPQQVQDPRVALGMTWEGVPSIRLLLTEAQPDASARHPITRRTATLLKHPAQAIPLGTGGTLSVRIAWDETGRHRFSKHIDEACGSSTGFCIGDGGISDIQDENGS